MITVIIAGGSGTRLWPLSTPEYPKHLLKLTGERTMIQQSYDRAAKLGDTVYVVTEASHAHHVREQLPELPDGAFLIEPGRRGTAHCIAFALDYIARHHDHNEPVAFIHADHHVRDTAGFASSFQVAAKVATENNEIVLIGVEPTFPSVGFGYIERSEAIDADRGVYRVKSFREKPDYETAQQYLATGNYLWNCGYFVGSVNIFLNEMQRSAPDLDANFKALAAIDNRDSQQYVDTYLAFDNQVIDVALIERAQSLAVVSAGFDWMDVGSFKDLHDAVSRDEEGNYLQGEDVYSIDIENVYVRNETSAPVAVIGLDNVIVVNTPQGLLVARKDVSHRVGEIAKQIQAKNSQ